MARRSQCSSAGDNPLDPNYLPPHYREEYRLAIDALIEEDLESYYRFLQKADVVDFLSSPEIQYIQESVQLPQEISNEQRYVESSGDGSSDTYWPIHSDLDAPDLDLGWPQLHSFIGPTEITTLVNPPEPDMPSIKEQARRLIKNAQQVIAIVMDMFTDVDILHDILTAATRNVAVYILLDEQNVHHFVNMLSNCRVNLQSIQLVRVRTVSGITYQCRSGKSFKGQMMDRFLLTDCRAVLSGNYSFMWSFEKIHRCMAHLFLGQLVSTFDEEFRILFAQSEPLIIENSFTPMEDFGPTQRRQYLGEKPSPYKDSRKFLSPEVAHSEEWGRHPYDERVDMDWRIMPKRKELFRTPVDSYNRFPSQQLRVDPSFEQSPSRFPLMENPAFKRPNYPEGLQGRYPFMSQQVVPESENQGRPFHRQPYLGLGKDSEYSACDKFWNQDYQGADQCSDPTLAHEMEPPDNFDPVLNYLSSARNVEFDQGSDNMSAPALDVPFSTSYPKRLTSGQAYPCQKSPTPSKSAEQKPFFHEHNPDRKDPSVKRGLRDWRISSYLSAYDGKGDDGLPEEPPTVSDPFEDPSTLVPPLTPRIDISAPKIPNVREFKVPAMPRASQIPGYAKNAAREQPKKLLDEPSSSPVVEETKATPSPSESSSTTEGERVEEADVKEHATSHLHREDSFRRKYNVAFPRCSRLRSSLIFSSLEQQQAQDGKSTPGQKEEESDKTESEPTKHFFISQVLGQRKTTPRQPFEWSSYINKPATLDSSATDSSKPDNENTEADSQAPSQKESAKAPTAQNEESLKTPVMQQTEQTKSSSSSLPRSKLVNLELPDQPTMPTKSLLGASPFIDMNDPDARLRFFKELAAKRKAAKAAEAEKSKGAIQGDQPTVKKGTAGPEELTEKSTASIISTNTEEDQKITEIVSVKQPVGQNNTSSGKQNELSPEEMTKDKVSAVTAEDKASSVKQPSKQDSGPKETLDTIPATGTLTKDSSEEESKEEIPGKHPMEKRNVSAKQENLGSNEFTEKIREAVTLTEPTKEEKRKEILFKNQPTDLKNRVSLVPNEPEENMAATELLRKTPEDKESTERVAVKPWKLEARNQEFTPKETIETTAATATPDKIKEEDKGEVSITQPVELKKDASVEKEGSGPKEKKQEITLKENAETSPATAAPSNTAREDKETVSITQAVELKNEGSGPEEEHQEFTPKENAEKTAATATPSMIAEENKEKCLLPQPVELINDASIEKEKPGPKEENQECTLKEITEKRAATVTLRNVAEEDKETVSITQAVELNNDASIEKGDSSPKEENQEVTLKGNAEKRATSGTSSMTAEEDKEKVSIAQPVELKNDDSIEKEGSGPEEEHQEVTVKETIEKGAATETASNVVEVDKDKVSITQPVELKNDASIEKEGSGPEERTEEIAVPPMTADTQEGKEVCSKPPAELQNPSSIKQGASGPVERTDKLAATGGASSAAEAEECKEKVPSEQPVKLQIESGGINKRNDAEDMAETFPTALPSNKAPEAEKTKEEVQMEQPTQLINHSFVKHEPQRSKENAEEIPAEKVSEPNEETSTPASQFSETSDQIKPEDGAVKTDSSANDTVAEQAQFSTGSGTINGESNPSATGLVVSVEPILPPSLPPEKPGSEISSRHPADSDPQIYPGHSPVVSSLHCTPTETLSSTLFPESTRIRSCELLNTAHSVPALLQARGEKYANQTKLEAARACQDSGSLLTADSPSDIAHVQSEVYGFGGDPEPSTASPESVEPHDPEVLNQTLPQSEHSLPLPVAEEGSTHLEISVESRADGAPTILNPSTADQSGIAVTSASSENPKYGDFPEDAESNVVPDSATDASQSDKTASFPQDPLIPAPPSPEANLTRPVPPSPFEAACCLSPSESAETVLSPEAEETPSRLRRPSHLASPPDQDSTDLMKSPVLPLPDLCSPTEPTSKVPPVSEQPCGKPEAVISDNQPSEPQSPTEKRKEDSRTEIRPDPNTSITNGQVRTSNCSNPQEATPGDAGPSPPQFKLAKSGQSRYHSSTANVISSSNLRDDTKLLLEQISANSQSRNEASKDSPVTDDEKEDEAEKNAKRKERGFSSFNRGQPKSNQERDKVLERIQSMRKERKVYSRFEV